MRFGARQLTQFLAAMPAAWPTRRHEHAELQPYLVLTQVRVVVQCSIIVEGRERPQASPRRCGLGGVAMPPDDMEVVRESVTLDHLAELAETGFGNLLKAVVDVGRGIMAIGGEMHADEEAALLGLGSSQTDLWGVNLYPSQYGQSDWIEFDSMINIRPRQGNRSRGVEDPAAQEKIVAIVGRLVRS